MLDTILRDEPEVGWQLLADLLPEPMSAASSTAKPHHRDWAPDETANVSVSEYHKMTLGVIQRLRKDVGTDSRRWKTLIEALDGVPEQEFDAILAQLKLALAAIDASNRILIWHSLRTLVARHREFPDAQWALPAENSKSLTRPTYCSSQ